MKMTQRHAHFSPEHLQSAIGFMSMEDFIFESTDKDLYQFKKFVNDHDRV